MKWFRFYSDALDDPKVQRLPGDLFKTWVNLLCLCAKNDGDLPALEDIAFALRLSDEQMSAAMDEFQRRGLVDMEGDTSLPHNWHGRQMNSDRDPTATERKQRQRASDRHALVTDASRVTVESVTPLDKIREEEIRVEKINTPLPPATKPSESLAAGAATPQAVQVVGDINEITDERAFDLVSAMCQEIHSDPAKASKEWRGRQLGIAKRLLERGVTAEKVRAFTLDLLTWRKGSIDMLVIENGIETWEQNAHAPRAAPGKSPPRSAQITPVPRLVVSGRIKPDGYRNEDPTPRNTTASG